MTAFDRLPGFVRSPPGLEHAIWRRLPAILLWGTVLPLAVTVAHRWMTPVSGTGDSHDPSLLLWDFTAIGFVILHWTLVLTVGCGCFIVRVMKGPAYVADAYPMFDRDGALEREDDREGLESSPGEDAGTGADGGGPGRPSP